MNINNYIDQTLINSLKKTNHSINSTQKSLIEIKSLNSFNGIGKALNDIKMSRIESEVRGTAQGNKNIQDGVSLIQTAGNSLDKMNTIAEKLRELAVSYKNDILTDERKVQIEEEAKKYYKELGEIITNTSFNKNKIFSKDEYVIQTGAYNGDSFKINLNGFGKHFGDILDKIDDTIKAPPREPIINTKPPSNNDSNNNNSNNSNSNNTGSGNNNNNTNIDENINSNINGNTNGNSSGNTNENTGGTGSDTGTGGTGGGTGGGDNNGSVNDTNGSSGTDGNLGGSTDTPNTDTNSPNTDNNTPNTDTNTPNTDTPNTDTEKPNTDTTTKPNTDTTTKPNSGGSIIGGIISGIGSAVGGVANGVGDAVGGLGGGLIGGAGDVVEGVTGGIGGALDNIVGVIKPKSLNRSIEDISEKLNMNELLDLDFIDKSILYPIQSTNHSLGVQEDILVMRSDLNDGKINIYSDYVKTKATDEYLELTNKLLMDKENMQIVSMLYAENLDQRREEILNLLK